MQPLQYDLRSPAAKDNSITHAAKAGSNTCNPIYIAGTILQLQSAMEFHRQLIHPDLPKDPSKIIQPLQEKSTLKKRLLFHAKKRLLFHAKKDSYFHQKKTLIFSSQTSPCVCLLHVKRKIGYHVKTFLPPILNSELFYYIYIYI